MQGLATFSEPIFVSEGIFYKQTVTKQLQPANVSSLHSLKSVCSKIVRKWVFFKLAEKSRQMCISSASILRKQCLCHLLFCFLTVATTFSNFQECFLLIAPQLHRLRICHLTQSLLMTSGTKTLICLRGKKLEGWCRRAEQVSLNLQLY